MVDETLFCDPEVAANYEQWYAGPGRRADRLEKELLTQLLSKFPLAQSLLDVGCGTGHFTRWFPQRGLVATGLDASQPMIAEAKQIGGATFLEGDALLLPFSDQEFDLVSLITSLEFVESPQRAIAEAARVAQRGLLLGVLNRKSLLAVSRRHSGKPIWQAAKFFSVGQLASIVKRACGSRLVALRWRTTLWPRPISASLPLPWGGFIGMSVQLSQENVSNHPRTPANV
jgi:ubiquinone/menaquinone biosynthesis C-methylase UbiE